MPWTAADADEHKKGLSDKQRQVWAEVANDALQRCLDKVEGDPSDEQRKACEVSAIKQASAVAGRAQEGRMAIDVRDQEGALTGLLVDDRVVPLERVLAALAEAQSREELMKAAQARAKKHGISVKDNGNRTPPSGYPESESEYGDPVNYRYPADADHARPALGYFNQGDARTSGGYSTEEWAIVGKRLAKLISRHMPASYEYSDGKLVAKGETEEAITRIAIDTGKIKISLRDALQMVEGMTEKLARAVLSELEGDLDAHSRMITDAFRDYWAEMYGAEEGEPSSYPWPEAIFVDDSEYGNSIVFYDDGALYLVGYEAAGEGITFAPRDSWEKVEKTYRKAGTAAPPAASETEERRDDADDLPPGISRLTESAASAVVSLVEGGEIAGLAEAIGVPMNPDRAPLRADVVLIRPGWGKGKGNHYYPASVLRQNAGVFEGVKMYTTDHRPGEKSVRTEVSVVEKVIGFADDGAPIGRVAIHDPDFAEATRNRDRLGTLGRLECSINALGRVERGTVDGKHANIVREITDAESVDWVTAAGAGGRAMNLVESAGGAEVTDEREVVEETTTTDATASTEQPEPILTKEQVEAALAEVRMPTVSRQRLLAGSYADEDALKQAIADEVSYIKELTGSGKPPEGAAVAASTDDGPDLAAIQERQRQVNARFGISRLRAAASNDK